MRIAGIEVTVADGRLAAWRMGDVAADAPVVVAIHGITATSRAWLAVASALDGRVELVTPDLRGRGASAPVGPPYGLDVHAEDVLALLDELGLRAPVIAGHSLGAWVACRFAMRHPDRVGSLVLVDGGLSAPGADRIEDPDAVIAATLGPAVARLQTAFAHREAYRGWWARQPAFAGSDVDPALLAAYADYDLGGEPPRMRSTVDPGVVAPDGRDLLVATDADALTCETVLLHAPRGLDGAPPPLLDPERVADWASAGDRRRAVPVPDTNHYTIAMGQAGARAVAGELLSATRAARR